MTQFKASQQVIILIAIGLFMIGCSAGTANPEPALETDNSEESPPSSPAPEDETDLEVNPAGSLKEEDEPTPTALPIPSLDASAEDLDEALGESEMPQETQEIETFSANPPEEIVTAVLDDFADRSGLQPEEAEIVSMEAQTYRDGSLGCPQKGQSYIQAITEGYRIVVQANNTIYDYRATQSGQVRLCSVPVLAPQSP